MKTNTTIRSRSGYRPKTASPQTKDVCATALEGIDENDPATLALLNEMAEGYGDGRDLDAPQPSTNRSMSYKHGFANGRDDRAGAPRATAAELRVMAAQAIRQDIAAGPGC
jgi:hypothetical protein